MDTREAIMGFSQGEKIKAGLIWASQIIQLMDNFGEGEKRAGSKTAGALVGMIGNEIMLAHNMGKDPAWEEMQRDLERARVMIDSGIPSEAVTHLTRALSRSTDVAGRAMASLKEEGLL
ncbi:MAG: hypothetical protein DRG82_13425 [Deltaproteobacteria bacterium]|nr:MAG: hypothetical protein B1H13_03905 [Desulfobacteraceae bacterium 4484_190.3]RLB14603.1 MAG: hypothetical protein DRG82_13425 [Deltaproteobacteria bacterium]